MNIMDDQEEEEGQLDQSIASPQSLEEKSASPVQDSETPDTRNALIKDVLQAANEVAREQFLKDMAFEETSGLYYDYKSGYYFDAERSLYYDGTNGIYYQYNYTSGSYEFHSQIPITEEDKECENSRERSKRKEKKERLPEKHKLQDSENDTNSLSELEEGELLTSSDSNSSDLSEDEEKEVTEAMRNITSSEVMVVAPCIRLIVTASDCLPLGTLFIVTYKGGTIGRFGSHDVLLDEESCCSKVHAKIFFLEDKYFICDLASVNGTFVNSERLSESKLESAPREIGHGSLVTIGTTSLTCHVHLGRETCLQCEPGVLQTVVKKFYPVVSKEKVRKKELRAIRQKYGISQGGMSQKATLPLNYVDRAYKRRKDVGSDNPHEKTEVADVKMSIDSRNKGFKMLSKMGWSEGQGLGKSNEGRTEPVTVQVKNDRSGLQEMSKSTCFEIDNKAKLKMQQMATVRKRFQQTESTEPESKFENEDNSSS